MERNPTRMCEVLAGLSGADGREAGRPPAVPGCGGRVWPQAPGWRSWPNLPLRRETQLGPAPSPHSPLKSDEPLCWKPTGTGSAK